MDDKKLVNTGTIQITRSWYRCREITGKHENVKQCRDVESGNFKFMTWSTQVCSDSETFKPNFCQRFWVVGRF